MKNAIKYSDKIIAIIIQIWNPISVKKFMILIKEYILKYNLAYKINQKSQIYNNKGNNLKNYT